MEKTKTLTITVISPDIGHIRSIIDNALQVAITHPKAYIEIWVTKEREKPDA